jgi:hypothetical protein
VIEYQRQRFAIVEGEDKRRRLIGLSGEKLLTLPLEAVVGGDYQVLGSLREQLLLEHPVNQYPDRIYGWDTLETGGQIDYLDVRGERVARDQILKVETARDGEGRELPSSRWRQVTRLRTDLEDGQTTLECKNVEITDLVLPPESVPTAVRVEVFGTGGDTKVENLSIRSPYDRVVDTLFTPFSKEIDTLVTVCREQCAEFAVGAAVARTLSLQENYNETNARYLRGIDPVFEAQLQRHSRIAGQIRDLKGLTKAWVGHLIMHEPDQAQALNRVSFSPVEDEGSSVAQPLLQFEEFLGAIEGTLSGNAMKHQTSSLRSRVQELRRSLLELEQEARPGIYTPSLYRGAEASDRVLTSCAEMISKQIVRTSSGESIADQMQVGGGLTSEYYDREGLEQALEEGAYLLTLSLSDQPEGGELALALPFSPDAVTPLQKELLPVLGDGRFGLYDLACARAESRDVPVASLALLRGSTAALLYDETEYLFSSIDADNTASMKLALSENSFLVPDQAFVRSVGEDQERLFHTWCAAVNPEHRGALALPVRTARELKSTMQQLKATTGGFLSAPPAEREQMEFVARTHQGEPYTRFSFGVSTMSVEQKNELLYLVHQGVFDGMRGVVSWVPTHNALHRDGVWTIDDGGAHQFFAALQERLAPECSPVGYLVSDVDDPNYGKTQEVVMPDGEAVELPIVSTSTRELGQLVVGDQRSFHTIRGSFRKPAKPQKGLENVGKWHAAAARGHEFGELFDGPMYPFCSGGTVNGWDIGRSVADMLKPGGEKNLVLLMSGFGGITDTVAADPETVIPQLCPELAGLPEWPRRCQELIDSGRLQIINPIESPERLKRYLVETGRRSA